MSLSDSQRQHVKELLLSLSEMSEPERASTLERTPLTPAERTELLALLSAGDAAPLAFLREGSTSEPAHVQSRIGSYEILGVLGSGGMSVVYRARQRSPIDRTVALKVIRPGFDSRSVIARFELERQALARLSHPNIAKIHDAGSDAQGNPYFVMELIDGPNLLEYCIERRIDLSTRLDLFVRVCRAVQHAHDRGLLHRDLKPSNVLVLFEDGRATPKVIDFGVSRVVAPDDSAARQTLDGQLVGTPQYMSPEQATRGASDLDVRTDVFSLGVLLYELLTGRLPHPEDIYSPEQLSHLAQNLMLLRPVAPSRAAPATLGAVAVPADLDCVILKALSGDREHRYASVGRLADDVERFMRGEPIRARPPTTLYLARKFIRRHRIAVGVLAGTMLGLAAIAATTAVGFYRAAEQRDRAEVAVAELTAEQRRTREALDSLTVERDRTRAALATTEEVATYLRQLLMRAHPAQLGPAANFKQILDAAAKDLVESPPASAMVRARVAFALAEPLYLIGEYKTSGELLEPVVELLERENTPESREVRGMVLMRLGYASSRAGDRLGSEAWFTRAGELARAHQIEDLEFKAQGAIAQSLAARGEYARGIEIMRDMLGHPVAKKDELLRASLLSNLGVALGRSGQTAEGEAFQREGYEIRLRRSPLEPTTYQMGWQLGTSMMELGKLEESAEFLDRNTQAAAKALGAEHPDVLAGVVMTQYAKARRGDGESVLPLLREAVDKQAKAGMPPQQVAFQEAYLVGAKAFAGLKDESVADSTALVARRIDVEGAASLNVIQLQLQIGSMYSVAGMYEPAHSLLIAAYESAVVPGSPARGMASRIAGSIHWNFRRAGEPQKAEEWKQRATELSSVPTTKS